MDALITFRNLLNRILMGIGGCVFTFMILLTCGNIASRQILNPIPGTFELMGYSGALVAAFALAHTQATRGHISVDILVNTFSPKLRRIVDAFNQGVCLFFFSLAAWQVALKAMTLQGAGEVSETLRIIYYPFTYAVAAGCSVLCLTLLTDLLQSIAGKKGTSS